MGGPSGLRPLPHGWYSPTARRSFSSLTMKVLPSGLRMPIAAFRACTIATPNGGTAFAGQLLDDADVTVTGGRQLEDVLDHGRAVGQKVQPPVLDFRPRRVGDGSGSPSRFAPPPSSSPTPRRCARDLMALSPWPRVNSIIIIMTGSVSLLSSKTISAGLSCTIRMPACNRFSASRRAGWICSRRKAVQVFDDEVSCRAGPCRASTSLRKPARAWRSGFWRCSPV